MKRHSRILILFTILLSQSARAQQSSDSAAVATTFTSLLKLCRNVDFNDPTTREQGFFHKVAPYIIYRGDNKQRNWKDFANYQNAAERKQVDEIAARINRTVNRDTAWRIVSYETRKESEGVWHAITVNYTLNGTPRKLLFAFLKVKGRYGLGDID